MISQNRIVVSVSYIIIFNFFKIFGFLFDFTNMKSTSLYTKEYKREIGLLAHNA